MLTHPRNHELSQVPWSLSIAVAHRRQSSSPPTPAVTGVGDAGAVAPWELVTRCEGRNALGLGPRGLTRCDGRNALGPRPRGHFVTCWDGWGTLGLGLRGHFVTRCDGRDALWLGPRGYL